MSGYEDFDFSSLPPLPKDHVKIIGMKHHKEKHNGSHETVQDGAKIGKVVDSKEIHRRDEHHNDVNLEDSEQNIHNGNCIYNNDLKVEQNIMTEFNDKGLFKEVEKLSLNDQSQVGSVQDGGNIGNVKKFPGFGSSLRKSITNSAVWSNAENYKMNNPKRGHCLIFNNSLFEPQTQLNPRNGTDEDGQALEILFTQLGFEVHAFNNLKLSALYSELHKYSYGTDHDDCDCLVVFFLSHGEENVLYATDYSFEVQKLFTNFTANNCNSLAGKPKMFFIQACRGSGVDDGVVLYHKGKDQTDYSSPSFYKIPVHADFLICYSTIEAHFSWRNTINGSWFIQSIVKVFREKANTDDVLSLMTSVNRRMIIDFESNCPSSPDMHSKKQTASINSTLMRKIYLMPNQ